MHDPAIPLVADLPLSCTRCRSLQLEPLYVQAVMELTEDPQLKAGPPREHLAALLGALEPVALPVEVQVCAVGHKPTRGRT